MKSRITAIRAMLCFALTLCTAAAFAQDPAGRKEMKRVDLSGAPGMEVISSITEYKVGDVAPKHFHNGIETAYVIEGAMVQLPGKEPSKMETGAVILNMRDVVHGGFKVIDKPLKLFTVHIVDKGKPLYAEPKAEAK